MCRECQKWQRLYMNGQMVIRRVACDCKDCTSTELTEPVRCVKCGCKIPIQLSDDSSSWDNLWLDENGNPIRNDEVLHT